jgi:hypothetical protein
MVATVKPDVALLSVCDTYIDDNAHSEGHQVVIFIKDYVTLGEAQKKLLCGGWHEKKKRIKSA